MKTNRLLNLGCTGFKDSLRQSRGLKRVGGGFWHVKPVVDEKHDPEKGLDGLTQWENCEVVVGQIEAQQDSLCCGVLGKQDTGIAVCSLIRTAVGLVSRGQSK